VNTIVIAPRLVRITTILLFALALFLASEYAAAPRAQTAAVDFARDIQPILQTHCAGCHGASKAMAQLRLDHKAGAARVIAPGNSKASLLLQRILGEGGDAQMPLGGEPLKEEQIALLRRWIDAGAIWPESASNAGGKKQQHWAFINPTRPALPAIKNKEWARNAIDYFVLDRLTRAGLQPAPEADRATLLRRVSFDLTGLPPTLAELDAFLNDPSPMAYEKVVDRLLASPRFGERMAMPWLDAARYADTNGYQVDGDRDAWRWRDWVIEAFNQNKPYDQFVIEQLAGDLLPNATLDQQIATAFNRNHRINAEGGVVPEEYRNEYVVDRVDTASTVFMGLTMGCARCHSHKFDPISHREFYQMAAFFNSIDEDGHSFDQGNSPPYIKAPTREQQQRLRQLQDEERNQETRFNGLLRKYQREQTQWEQTLKPDTKFADPFFDEDRLIVRMAMDEGAPAIFNKSERAYHDQYDRKPNEKPISFDIGFEEGAPRYVDAPAGQGVAFDGKLYFDAGIHANYRYNSTSEHFNERFTIAAWIYPDSEQSGTILGKVSDAPADVENGIPRAEGYGLYFLNGKLHFNMVFRWGEDTLRVETENTLPIKQWQHVAVVFDGLEQWERRVRIYVNGQVQPLKHNQRNFFLMFAKSKDTLKFGAGGGPRFRFKGALDEIRMYTRGLTAGEIAALACGDAPVKIAAMPAAKRTPAQTLKLQKAWLALAAPPELKGAMAQWQAAIKARQKYDDELPTLMVMQEMPQLRKQFLLKRGAYDAPGEEVSREVLAALNPFPAGAPRNRLGLAEWLLSDEHPLTSRVAVNRFWQMLFGTGLVKTPEDFGLQSEPPSHPELLDWLAVEFRSAECGARNAECGKRRWDIKALLKTIVTSATYRQSSEAAPHSALRDPQSETRLLARGPRVRLPAEMVRDQALFISGLLVEKIGGPSVKPYQPEGLYKGLASATYERDRGEGLWRRSLYTYWKRTILSPTMQVFDASAREFCNVRDVRTNTPLQSLNLMNDVTYIEAARLLAERAMKEGGVTPEQRLAWAFRVVTSRAPTGSELHVLLRSLNGQREKFMANPQNAAQLLGIGERRNDARLEKTELAAYATVMSMLLNLDEAITKQ
jgi:mono/diheme cytochrome c family protein